MLTELGDFHGSLMYAYQSGFRGTAKRPTRKNPLAWVDSTSQAIYRTRIPVPYRANTHFFEEERIAYLEVMGTAAMDNELILAGIDSIRTKVCELAARKPIGWILDLRANAGGNVHPMMSGLGDLIPDANLGGDTKNGKGLRSNWRTEEARFYMDGWSAAGELGATCPELVDEQSQIAILASRYTASSGEVVVSSFKGQINTRVFGERTSGYSTTNGWFVLDEDWIFMPALAYYQSVDGTIHQDGILPEEEIIEELDLNNLLEGKTIEAAKRWLKME